MPYTPQSWADNDPTKPVSAARMQHIEDGIAAVANGGSLSPLGYTLTTDGTNYYARDNLGTIVAQGLEYGAVVTAALPAAGSTGADFAHSPGNFTQSTTPLLPAGITRKLRLRGSPNTLITASAGGESLVGLNKVASGDIFQNIELEDLLFDAANLGGIGHVLFGTRKVGAGQMQDVNLQSVKLRRLRAINVYTDPAGPATNNRWGIWGVIGRSVAGNFTTNDCLAEDVRVEGGTVGVVFGGQNPGANAPVDMNRNGIVRCYHDTGIAPNLVGASNNFQLGGYATGRDNYIKDSYGNRCGDAGCEIDVAGTAVENTTIDNGLNSNFFVTLFNAQTYPGALAIVFRKDSSRTTDAGCAASNSFGWSMRTSASLIALPHVRILDCEYLKDLSIHNAAAGGLTGGAIYRDDTGGLPSPQAVTFLEVERFKATFLTGTNANASTFQPFRVNTNTGTTSAVVCKFRDIYVFSTYTRGAGTMTWVDFEVTGGGIYFDLDGFFTNSAFTSFLNGTHRILRIGSTTTTLLGLRIRRLIPLVEGAPQTRGISFTGANITFAKDPGTIENCDFQKLTAGFEIEHTSAGLEAKVRYRDNVWPTKPAPVALTGLVTATGKTLSKGWDAVVTFIQGSGAGITAIDYSTDGGTTYTNFLTQAAAALPAGFCQLLGPLPTDALIKVTFTTTQPTITLVPVKP